MNRYKGLYALIAILYFSNPLLAKFIVTDEVVKIDGFNKQIEPMGAELSAKTGVNLYMSLVKDTDNNQSIIAYQQALIKTLKEPAVLFSFVENSKQVQIYAEDKSLYKLFDRDQIMDPLAIWPFFNGRVIPIIGAKAPKEVDPKDKYAVAMYNGYAEISEQIAESKGVVLSTAIGDTNKTIYKYIISGLFFVSLITVLKLARDGYRKKRGRMDADV